MRKKLFTLLFAVSAGVGTMFASTKIGDLYYDLDSDTKTATVVYNYQDPYSELITLTIPASVTVSKVTYDDSMICSAFDVK